MRRSPERRGDVPVKPWRWIAAGLVAINVMGGIALAVTDGGTGGVALMAGSQAQVPMVPEEEAAVLHPIERIAFSDDWRKRTTRTVKAGGFAFAILRHDGNPCADVRSTAPDTRFYVMAPLEITAPSSRGSRTGTYYEALLPRNAATCLQSRYVFAEWQPDRTGTVSFKLGEATLTVDVSVEGILRPPRRPFYIALTNSYLLKGHCATYCPREAELAHKYSRLLAAHGIRPMQNWIGVPSIKNGRLDLDRRMKRRMSFRQTTMAYAGNDPIGFPRMDHYRDKIAYLRALETTIQEERLLGRAWVYAVDEPKLTDKLINKLKLYKLFAPSVRIMVTTPHDPLLDPLVDTFAPVINHLVKGGERRPSAYAKKGLWSYASCMGSCGPNRKAALTAERRPGADTGLPDFLIDRPVLRLFAFFKTLDAMKADGALYYEAVEGYPLLRKGIDLMADTWNFGGNGDGLLLFPGRPGEFGLNKHQPIASLRLKLIRHAIERYW